MFIRELAKRLGGAKITREPSTSNSAVIFTKYRFYTKKLLVKPFLFLFFNTPKAGAQTTIYAGKPTLTEYKFFLVI